MIKKQTMTVKKVTQIALDTIEMVLDNKMIAEMAVPGQFLHVSIPFHTLRRPISIADVNQETNTITILFKIVGSGTRKLATFQPGMTIDVLGPNGNGFNLTNKDSATVLLIGGGIGVPPLYYLAQSLVAKGSKVISILGFQTKEHVFYEQQFKKLGQTIIVTDDGSYGQKGYVTNMIDQVGSFDCYYSCGPLPMLRAVSNKLENKEGYISLEERMGCGIGACYACVIAANDGTDYKKICQDGPVFQANEVIL